MTSAKSPETVLCVDCGSTNDAAAQNCWLCGQSLGPSTAIRVPRAPAAEPTAPIDSTSAVIVVTLVMVGAGLGAVNPGLLIPYVLITTPALVATFVKSHRHRQQDNPMGPGEKILKFFVSAAMVVAVLVGIGVALVVAGALLILAICFFQVRFH